MTIPIVGLGDRGPQPASAEVEREVRARLHELEPLLDIRWCPNARVNPKTGHLEGRYALISTWPSSDPRWEMHRRGELGEPFDILGWFTEAAALGDWHEPSALPVDPDVLLDRAIAFLGKIDLARDPWKHRMRRVLEANRDRRRQVRDQMVDEGLQHMLYYREKLAGAPIVQVGVDLADTTLAGGAPNAEEPT